MKDLNRLRQQVKAAWAKLSEDERAQLEPKIRAAHAYTLAVRGQTITATAAERPPPRELLMLYSLLNDDPDALVAKAVAPEGLPTYVDPEGAVYFGGVDYDATDPGWAYCFPAWHETKGSTPPFQVGNVIGIPDSTTLAILGDWGAWNTPAQDIAAAVKAADYLIHVGDVYYAGTNSNGGQLDPYESTHFVDVWPGRAGYSFALNSNHDMYAHATGYALTTLKAPAFQTQGGNCFALHNKTFRIVGLDSAYYAPDDNFSGYMIGSLGDPQGEQMTFLQTQISQLTPGQRLILLTHHTGLQQDGSVPTKGDNCYLLWQQVTQVVQSLPAGASKNVLWYWGHAHAGAVYTPQQVGGITIYPRCCGHGSMPWGVATDLSQSGNVLWFEKQVLGPGDNYFVTNGYATLTLAGTALTESFWNQNGVKSWSGPPVTA